MLKSLIGAAAAALAVFAFPSASAQSTLPHRAVLGAAARNAADGGAEILVVRPNTPAAQAGFAVGDVVHRIDGRSVSTARDFVDAVRTARANRRMTFSVTRGGATQTLIATLADAPRETAEGLTIDYGSVLVAGTLRRTLISYPSGPSRRRPAMLIVGGIGCYSIDDQSTDDPYRHLAQDLSRRGIVVMRLEKSGMGDSQGPACATVDFNQEHTSNEAALAALRADRRVDPNQVFIFGHSIGTLHAPILANNQPVAGVIASEGAVLTWIEYEYINTRRQLTLAGASPADISATMLLKTQCMDRAMVRDEPVADVIAATPDCANVLVFPASQAYMRQLTALNIAAPWTTLSAPALLIYGTADFVTDREEHQQIVDIINAAHPGHATLAVIEGMEHALTQGGSQEASWARHSTGEHTPYEPRFSQTVGDWICARARCAA